MEFVQNFVRKLTGLTRIFRRLAQNDKVIGIPDKAAAPVLKGFIQFIQEEVGENRRKGRTLGNARLQRRDRFSVPYFRLELQFNEAEDLFINDILLDFL